MTLEMASLYFRTLVRDIVSAVTIERTFAQRAVAWLCEVEHLTRKSDKYLASVAKRAVQIDFAPEQLSSSEAELLAIGEEYWPSDGAELGAFRLLSVYLEEALATLPPWANALRFDGRIFVPVKRADSEEAG